MTSTTRAAVLSLFILLGAGCGTQPAPAPKPPPPPPAPAAALAYTDPVAGPSEWKLVQNASSTPTLLVLDVVGPSNGTKYRGIGFTLGVDRARVAVARFKDDQGKELGFHKDTGVFLDVEPGTLALVPPVLQVSGIRDQTLMAGIFQSTDDSFRDLITGLIGSGATAKDCSVPVMQIALALDPALKSPPGTVSLRVLKARSIPEVVMRGVLDSYIWDTRERRGIAVVLKVGTLSLKSLPGAS